MAGAASIFAGVVCGIAAAPSDTKTEYTAYEIEALAKRAVGATYAILLVGSLLTTIVMIIVFEYYYPTAHLLEHQMRLQKAQDAEGGMAMSTRESVGAAQAPAGGSAQPTGILTCEPPKGALPTISSHSLPAEGSCRSTVATSPTGAGESPRCFGAVPGSGSDSSVPGFTAASISTDSSLRSEGSDRPRPQPPPLPATSTSSSLQIELSLEMDAALAGAPPPPPPQAHLLRRRRRPRRPRLARRPTNHRWPTRTPPPSASLRRGSIG